MYVDSIYVVTTALEGPKGTYAPPPPLPSLPSLPSRPVLVRTVTSALHWCQVNRSTTRGVGEHTVQQA